MFVPIWKHHLCERDWTAEFGDILLFRRLKLSSQAFHYVRVFGNIRATVPELAPTKTQSGLKQC